MIRLKIVIAASLCLGTLLVQAHGQALQEGSIPRRVQAPPAFGVLDGGGFFKRNPGALERISDQIRKLERDHGYMIYLVVEPVLIATTASERASELREDWVPDGNGLVLVFESDSRSLGIGRDLVGSRSIRTNPARVPTYETAALLSRAMGATNSSVPPDVYLEALVGQLTTEFDRYFTRRAAPPPAERSLKIALLVTGILALLGLGAIGLGGLLRHSKKAAVRNFRFPAVDLPERLGAPCGGSVTSRNFTAPECPPPL